MTLVLRDLPVFDFFGATRNFEQIAAVLSDRATEQVIGEPQLQDDAVTARVLRDDAAVDGERAVTTNHIRNQAVTLQKIDVSVWPAVHLIGLAGARPAASAANNGFYWTSTDVDGGTTYRSNGVSWVQIAAGVTAGGGGGGGTVTYATLAKYGVD